jgi:hypothetical protein
MIVIKGSLKEGKQGGMRAEENEIMGERQKEKD